MVTAPKRPLLNDRQKAFCRHYANCLQGKKAAILAGYKDGPSADVTASELLAMPKIRAEVDRLITAQSRMTGEEIIARLEKQATATIALFLKPGTLEIDPAAVHQHGDLIQRIWITAEGPRITLHDSQKALELLGKTRALFIERAILNDLEGMDVVESSNGDGETPAYSRPATSRATGGD